MLPIRFVRAVHSTMLLDNHYGYKTLKLQGQQLTDILCVIMFGVTFFFLNSLDAGAIYFWMKDMTQEFLKLQVIYTAVEIFDKVWNFSFHGGIFPQICLPQFILINCALHSAFLYLFLFRIILLSHFDMGQRSVKFAHKWPPWKWDLLFNMVKKHCVHSHGFELL